VQEHRVPEAGLINLRQTVAAQLSNIPLEPGEIFSPLEFFEKSAHQYKDSAIGSEALFHLGEALERAGKREEAIAAYERVVLRAEKLRTIPGLPRAAPSL
jgi:hypothetical protein